MVNTYYFLIIFLIGAAIGSFLGAYTFRAPEGISIKKGRSFCPKCKAKIFWYDNIPLISYMFLKGKCRSCGKKISSRYFIIEFACGLTFLMIAYLVGKCGETHNDNLLCSYSDILKISTLPYLLIVSSLLIAVFVIDFEHKLILDELVFSLYAISFIVFLLSSTSDFFLRLLAGFALASFLLMIHLLTKGKGMGLGDVKFALVGGSVLGWPFALIWLYTSFILGAGSGIILIFLRKARFGKQIAFGPFLVLSMFLTLLMGNKLLRLFFPILK